MKRRDMKLLLEERFERIALLETRIDTMDQLVEGYRAREQAIFDTLHAAKESATRIIEQANVESAQIREQAEAEIAQMRTQAETAQAEADGIRVQAREQAEALLSDAIATANTLKKEAERQGVEISATVKADSDRMLRDAEIIKREYEEMVDSFNAMLEQNASELEITAARFAEFVKNRKIDRSEVRLDGNAFYKSVGELSDAHLPDASGDPALLMQNIYRIQNRPLPEDRPEQTASQPEQPEAPEQAFTPSPEFPMEEGSGADERLAEPFSESAWKNEAQQSEAEPQAEFTKSFDGAYVQSDYTVPSETCNVTPEDVESAFDALLSDETEHHAEELPQASALTTASATLEPMDDVSRALDEYLDTALEPSGKLAQYEVPQEQTQGPEGAQAVGENEPTCAEQTAEPYSEQAWQQSAFTSELEPQAEGALFTELNDIVEQAPCETVAPVAQTAESVIAVSNDVVESALEDYFLENAQFSPAPRFADDEDAQGAYPKEPASDPEAANVFDDYLAALSSPASATQENSFPATQAEAAAPEPYSEQAWRNATASELEPQAEGTLFHDVSEQINPTTYEPSAAPIAAPITAPITAAPTEAENENPVSDNDVASAMDDYFAQVQAFTQPMPNVSPAPVSLASDQEKTDPDQDAASAFGDYLAGIPSFSPATSEATAPAPEPYSEQAWRNATVSELEPQAESAVFAQPDMRAAEPATESATEREIDDFLAQIGKFSSVKTVVAPEVEAAEIAPERATASDMASEIDDYFANLPSFAPERPIPATEAPASFSEQAWSHRAVSEYEPQAEGASFLSNSEQEEEQEPAPAPRKYNDYGEIREWEPDPEPEMEDIPTVSRYMGQSGGDEISLDQLLDEIIKAGD